MEQYGKKMMKAAGIAAAGAAAAGATVYATAKLWVKMAMDREEPRLMKKLGGGISGVVFRYRHSCVGNCTGRRKRGRKDRKGIEKSGVIRYSKNVVFHK